MIHAVKVVGEPVQVTRRILAVVPTSEVEMGSQPAKRARYEEDFLGFSRRDKEGTMQPHDDALVVNLRIINFDVKRVMVD